MAKKKSDGVNKSQEIRDFYAANPDAKPAQVVEALAEKGIVVDAQFVSTVKSNAKKAGAGKSRKASRKASSPRKTATRAARPKKAAASGEVSLQSLLKAKELVAEMGGVEDARNALAMLEQLRD